MTQFTMWFFIYIYVYFCFLWINHKLSGSLFFFVFQVKIPFYYGTVNSTTSDSEVQSKKMVEFHWALTNTPEWLVQCDTKEELDKHIETIPNKKTYLKCSFCDYYFRDLDALSKYMNIKCKICEIPFEGERNEHFKN